jgi:hypothetical protein
MPLIGLPEEAFEDRAYSRAFWVGLFWFSPWQGFWLLTRAVSDFVVALPMLSPRPDLEI